MSSSWLTVFIFLFIFVSTNQFIFVIILVNCVCTYVYVCVSESVSICHHLGCLCIYIFVFICVNKSVHLCHHLGQLCLFSKGERSANSDEGLWSSSSWKQPRHNQHPCLELRYVKVRLFQHFHPAKIRRAARKYESCRCSAVRLKRA